MTKRPPSSRDSQEPEPKIQRIDNIFSNMRLRRIVKENHGHDISQLSFFNDHLSKKSAKQIDTSNVLASVGGCQLSVYDNEHCGDHLDIMSNFDITPSHEKQEARHRLKTVCWFYRESGDALMATAGADAMIHVLSLANSEEIILLTGHTSTVSDLQSHPLNDHYMLSTSKDGTARLWDLRQERCLVVFEANAALSISCFHPSGTTFITGSEHGDIYEWTIPSLDNSISNDSPVRVSKQEARIFNKLHGSKYMDCIRYANGNLLTKSVDNQLHYWRPDTQEIIHSFSIASQENNHSRFDVSRDGHYLCVGSHHGYVYVFDIHTGDLLAELCHKKATKAVRCSVFTRDCRQIVVAGEDAFIMRYDYIDRKTLDEWAKWRKSK
ncbi:rRNA accumulation- protein [Mucor velutinosus]|uniref:rRNA accumulation- protein n=1 Tax=Mucor velutinosus TaxID=708070 RepID=A0AAN7HWG6_9FUNG|nr:rRNA accumulation- protein [Mucor velutinosus]